MRICKKTGKVKLSLPHRFSYGAKYKYHINFFDRKWFEENLKYQFSIKTTTWSPFKFFLFFPHHMNLTIYKKRLNYYEAC